MRLVSELARAMGAIVRTRGDLTTALNMDALKPYPKAVALIRGAIDTGVLSPDGEMFGDFIGTAPSRSIIATIDAVSPWRRAAPGVPVLVNLSPPVASWRVEGQPFVITSTGFTIVRLSGDKSIGGITVFTVEAGRELGTLFIRQLGDDAAAAIAFAEGQAMFDPANDGTGSAPPALTFGATTIASSGSDPASLRADLGKLLGEYGGDLARSVWAVSPAAGARLALAGDGMGDADVTTAGGYLAGLPVCVGAGLPDSQIALVDPSGTAIFDGGATFTASTEASLVGKDEAGEDLPLNLWQSNLSATRFTRVLDWESARPDAIGVLSGIAWDGTATPPDAGKRKVSRDGKPAP